MMKPNGVMEHWGFGAMTAGIHRPNLQRDAVALPHFSIIPPLHSTKC
jgi:hypothetical protein